MIVLAMSPVLAGIGAGLAVTITYALKGRAS
jgi:hypothetical protein